MKYVLVGWYWNIKREAYVRVPPHQSGGFNLGIEYTEHLLDARIYDDAAFAACVVIDAERQGLRGLRIKKITDKEWFEAKLRG